MKALTAKLLNEYLKKGWSAIDFANYLQITTEEFWKSLEKTFTSKALRDFKTRLLKNEKKHKKVSTTNLVLEEMVQNSNPSTTEEIIKIKEDVKEDVEIKVETTIEEKEEASKPSLKDLEKQESSLQRLVCKKEAEIHELYSKKFKIVKSLQDEKKSLDDLKIQIEKHKNNILLLNSSLNAVLEEIDSSNVELTKGRDELNSIREKILEEKKVCIFAFSNGNIEFENNSFDIPDTWTDVYEKLIKIEEFEALTIKQIKQLAKIFVLTKKFKKEKIQFDIIFDSDELNNFFKLITK